MFITRSDRALAQPSAPLLASRLEAVSEDWLRGAVEALAVPRHFVANATQNRETGDWIAELLSNLGYDVVLQGRYRNVVATPPGAQREPLVLVGAHYDSVPGCPGADDNASALAAMLGAARACMTAGPLPPVAFVAFNREEDGLVGSTEFVRWLQAHGPRVAIAHILEMVGYCTYAPGSQRIPASLRPFIGGQIPDRGDFLGILANHAARPVMDPLLSRGRASVPELPVVALQVPQGLDRALSVLRRSDHAPFWDAGIAATMWTDTSEFRNPHYHRDTDTPDTLDYDYLASVTRLLLTALTVAD